MRAFVTLLPVKWIIRSDISGHTQSWIVIRDRLETLDISFCHSNRVSCPNSPQLTTVHDFCIQQMGDLRHAAREIDLTLWDDTMKLQRLTPLPRRWRIQVVLDFECHRQIKRLLHT